MNARIMNPLHYCLVFKILLLFAATTFVRVDAFTSVHQRLWSLSPIHHHLTTLGVQQISSTETVSELLEAIAKKKKYDETSNEPSQNNDDDDDNDNTRKSEIKDLIEKLEQESDETSSEFSVENNSKKPPTLESAFGLYDVSYVQSARENDNPVGGKWTNKKGLTQKIFRTRRTFQHLLPKNTTGLGSLIYMADDNDNNDTDTKQGIPVVAEAVNVISLDAFFGLLRLTVILRGDAVALSQKERASPKMIGPLSNLAVRAYFDPPKIILGKSGRFINISIGPPSSVVLDAPYVDDSIRIGKGGTSGTKFVFKRCGSVHDLLNKNLQGKDDAEAVEFSALLNCPPIKKAKFCSIFGFISAIGMYLGFVRKMKVIGLLMSFTSTLTVAGVLFSSGGIEKDHNQRQSL